MLPLDPTLTKELPELDVKAISIAFRFGTGREPSQHEISTIDTQFREEVGRAKEFMFLAVGENILMEANGTLGFAELEPQQSNGVHASEDPASPHLPESAAEVFGYRPIPDLIEGWLMAGEARRYSYGHFPESLTPNEIARYEAAYKAAHLGATDQDAKEFIQLIVQNRRQVHGLGRVIDGNCVIRVTETGQLRFIPLDRLSEKQQAAYADAREQAGLVRVVADPPLSRSDFEKLGEAVEGVTENTCDGHLTRVIRHLEEHGLPVVPLYQSFMRAGIFCDCLAARAYRDAPLGDMWPDSEAEDA